MYPVNSGQPLSPGSTHIGLMNKAATVAEMKVTHGFSNMGFHSPRPT